MATASPFTPLVTTDLSSLLPGKNVSTATGTPGQPAAGPGSTTMPASFGGPLPAGQTPPPSVNPQVVFTDATGKGYDPAALSQAWNGGQGAFATDPLNVRAGDIVQQYSTSGAGMTPPPAAPAAPAGGAFGPSAAGGSAFGAPVGGANDPRSSGFLNMLMSRIDQTPQVDPNDPAIKSSTDAYAAQQERSKRSYLSQAAEKGGENGNTDAISRSLTENAGQATGAFQAGLINQERTARRSQIQNILSLYGSYLSSDQQNALTKELNDMNLAERAYEFDSNDAYRYSPFAAGATA